MAGFAAHPLGVLGRSGVPAAKRACVCATSDWLPYTVAGSVRGVGAQARAAPPAHPRSCFRAASISEYLNLWRLGVVMVSCGFQFCLRSSAPGTRQRQVAARQSRGWRKSTAAPERRCTRTAGRKLQGSRHRRHAAHRKPCCCVRLGRTFCPSSTTDAPSPSSVLRAKSGTGSQLLFRV